MKRNAYEQAKQQWQQYEISRTGKLNLAKSEEKEAKQTKDQFTGVY